MSWDIVKLGDIVKMVTGKTPPTNNIAYFEGEYLWVNPSDFRNKVILNSKRTVSEKAIQEKKCNILPIGTVLLSCIGDIGKVGILKTVGTTNQQITGLIPNNRVYSDYLYYFLIHNKSKLEALANKAVVAILNNERLRELEVILPPLETQKRIADILDAADALRQKDQELLKKYDELAQAIFINMFGDPVKNEKHWEKVKMEKLMTIVRGGSPRPIDKFLGGKYPWIKIGDATKGDDVYLKSTREHIIEEGLSKTRLLPEGSLIFANCGVSLGFARIITFEGCIHDGWLAFSDFDDLKINKIFLLKALNSITEYFRNSAPEGTQPNLNTGIIKDFELILPPLELQNKFEHILKSFKAIKENAEYNLKSSNQLFDSFLLKAFNGELVKK